MTQVITSLQNPRVKHVVRLRNQRARKAQQRIVIDGAREVLRAIEAGIEVAEVFLCPALLRREEARDVLQWCNERHLETLEVSPAVFGKLAYGERAEGVVAVAKSPRADWRSWSLPECPLVVVLERLEKPGNLGGILRTADAVGASAVLVADGAVDVYNPNTIRASLGTVFSVPVAAAPGGEILDWLREHPWTMFAARVDGAVDYTEVDFTGPTVLVLGSEAEGLSPQWHAVDITPVVLPMKGQADSLNVSVTAAVLLYETLRQRSAPRR